MERHDAGILAVQQDKAPLPAGPDRIGFARNKLALKGP